MVQSETAIDQEKKWQKETKERLRGISRKIIGVVDERFALFVVWALAHQREEETNLTSQKKDGTSFAQRFGYKTSQKLFQAMKRTGLKVQDLRAGVGRFYPEFQNSSLTLKKIANWKEAAHKTGSYQLALKLGDILLS